ncbi:hypothetical protein TYRP_012794 [Tyrophagus putrescentiae]|nr:hypothetical protein TYRP_023038 [Tyrophagus putrescentiae]KAH9407244.1 hypothetical protein TYRP_012794 [Tyrophagus putrescentiae]
MPSTILPDNYSVLVIIADGMFVSFMALVMVLLIAVYYCIVDGCYHCRRRRRRPILRLADGGGGDDLIPLVNINGATTAASHSTEQDG